MNWILILTIFTGIQGGDVATITSVSGFKTQKECVDAGIQWKKDLHVISNDVNFSCVVQTK